MLSGYKTYVFSALLVISALLFAFGLIDREALITLVTIFGGGGLISTRVAIKKIEAIGKNP